MTKIIVNLGLCISVYDIMRSIDGGFVFPRDGVLLFLIKNLVFIHYLSCSLIQVHFRQSLFFFFFLLFLLFIDVWFHSLNGNGMTVVSFLDCSQNWWFWAASPRRTESTKYRSLSCWEQSGTQSSCFICSFLFLTFKCHFSW